MDIKQIRLSGNASNCYIIYSKDSKEGVLVDPGGDADKILAAIEEEGLNVKNIVLTHGHGDHIGALEEVREKLGATVMAHEDEEELLGDKSLNLSMFLFAEAIETRADRLLKDGEIVEIEDLKIGIIHTPGHTKGGICLDIGHSILTGDTLFAGSVGRTDFPGGCTESLIRSIKEKLLVYPEETKIYPGHMHDSTIGSEKKYNMFLR